MVGLRRIVNLNIRTVLYLEYRCRRLRDALSDIPGTRGILDFLEQSTYSLTHFPYSLELIARLLRSSNKTYPLFD